MPQESIAIVRAAIDAFNRGEWASVLKDAAPHFEADLSRAVGPNHGMYGRDRWLRLMTDLNETWETIRIEPHEFIEAGEQVVVPVTLHSAGRDGVEVQARPTWTFTIRGGAIERFCLYQERQEALEAAGLSK